MGDGRWLFDEAGSELTSINPTTGEAIATVRQATQPMYYRLVDHAVNSFPQWRDTPAPKRGQLVRDLGNRIRELLEPLGELVTLEVGKIRSEGVGEIQEMIDICEFAVGLSRQLYGNAMHSERSDHRMFEQYHPFGAIGIISAFNFPAAVWSWNASLAAICGDTMVWKPSPLAPLTAIAIQNICNEVSADHHANGVFQLAIGDSVEIGSAMADDTRLPLISFTGSVAVGRQVAARVAARLGRSLLELGGNNAVIIEPDADLDMAVQAVLFAAVGTTGQRCTTTRRLFVHRSVANQVVQKLAAAYQKTKIGDPMDPSTTVGPLISSSSVKHFLAAIERAQTEGGQVVVGGRALGGDGFFVEPTIIKMPSQTPVMHDEVFAPILYVVEYDALADAIAMQNAVPQGLSSALFTDSITSSELFLSARGSDCGIANVNMGTSGAEIGGAFGGEKDTGGGRESGSDAWKIYMRRQTCTVNWSNRVALAQGIRFGQDVTQR